MLRFVFILFILVAPHLSSVAAQEDLTVHRAYETARARNSMLLAAESAADAVLARQSSATLPPDPQLQIGVMNASLPGLRTDMPGAMLPSVQAMQMVPFPGKLRLKGELARQSTAMAGVEVEVVWWEVRAATARAFYEIYRADRQITVMEETLDWLIQVEQVATSMYSVGRGRQSDVLRAGVAVARMKADIARMRAMRSTAAARLNAILNRPSDTPVPAVSFTPLPGKLPEAAELERWAEESRPLLVRARLSVEQSLTREGLARLELWPDVSLGVQYGQRPGELGTERMGSVMLGFSVPVFASRRQMHMRTEAAAMGGVARAELASTRSEAAARIGELLAELERARVLVTLYRTEVLPQAEANVSAAFSSYRVGRVDFMTLLDAQMTLSQLSQELHVLLAEYGQMIAELEMAAGRELPMTTPTIGETG